MRGNEIHVGRQGWIVAPNVPDFTRCYRNIDRTLYLLDERDKVIDLLLPAVDRLVANDDADDVAVVSGEAYGGRDLPIIALLVLVDPGADHDLEAEFGGDGRHHFDAAGRGVQADGAGQRRELFQISADFFGVGNVVHIGVRCPLERRVGHARKNTFEIGRSLFVPQQPPKARMHSGDEQHNSDDGAHRDKP